MQLFNFVSVKLSLCLIIGILVGFYLELSQEISSALLLVALILLIAFIKSTGDSFSYFGIISYFFTICLGIFIVVLANPRSFNTHYSNKTISEAAVWKVKIREVLKPSSFSNNYLVEARTIDSFQVSGKLLLTIQNDSNKPSLLHVDEELLLISGATALTPPLNPHQFNYKSYLKKLGVYHRLQIDTDSYSKTKNTSKTLKGIAANVRKQLILKLKEAPFGTDELGVIQALLLGQRNDISADTYDDYKDAGAVHILAVSGLHIGIILLLLQFLLKPIELLPKGKTLKLFAIVLLLWAFAFVAGLSPSIFRAVMMFSFIAYAMYLNRPSNTFNILALSIFFILLIKPLVLFQVGFQMSYAAVFAIVWIYPKLQRFWYPKNWVLRKGWQLLSVSCAAQLGVLPISLFYFHQFPALFIISNLVVIPFLGLILGFGILVLILTAFNLLPDVLAIAYNFLITKMNGVIAWVAEQESFVFRDIPFDRVQLMLAYVLLLVFVTTLSKPTFKKTSLFFVVIFSLHAWLIYNQWQLNRTEHFILGHQTANTFFLHQKGSGLTILGSKNLYVERIINNYKIAESIDSINNTSLQNSYVIGKKKLYVIDSLEIVSNQKQPDYLLLTQSPKINLDRVLDSIKPKQVLFDGSNYKSYVRRWKQTCLKKEIPFHYTGEKGAFYFELE